MDQEITIETAAMIDVDVAHTLAELLRGQDITDEFGNSVAVKGTPALFSETGMLTMNEGLTVRLADGSEFQLTIVQSRDPEIN